LSSKHLEKLKKPLILLRLFISSNLKSKIILFSVLLYLCASGMAICLISMAGPDDEVQISKTRQVSETLPSQTRSEWLGEDGSEYCPNNNNNNNNKNNSNKLC